MKVYAQKICDMCNKVVAEQDGLFFRTTNKYYTVRLDMEVPYYRHEKTIKGKAHICSECWHKIWHSIVEEG